MNDLPDPEIREAAVGELQVEINIIYFSNLFLNINALNFENDKYIFDSFVFGNPNNLAFSAGIKAAEQPRHSLAPLYIHVIWGSTCLVKIYLLCAFGNQATLINFNVLLCLC